MGKAIATLAVAVPVVILILIIVSTLVPTYAIPDWLADNWLYLVLGIGAIVLIPMALKAGGADLVKPLAGWIPLFVLVLLGTFFLGRDNVVTLGNNLGKAFVEATDGDGVILQGNDPSRQIVYGNRSTSSYADIRRFAASHTFNRIELPLQAGTASISFTDYKKTCLRWDRITGAAYPVLQGSYDGNSWQIYRNGMAATYVRFYLPSGEGDATIAVERRPNSSSCT